MAVDAKIRWKADMDFQKVINGYNKILAKQDQQIKKLKETARISRKADRETRKAARSMSRIQVSSLAHYASAAFALRGIIGLFRQIDQMSIQPFENVKQLLNTSKKLVQLQAGTGDLKLTERQQKLGRIMAERQGIPNPAAQELVFSLGSRELTEKQIRNFPRFDFLPNIVEAMNFAADAVKQFESLSLKTGGLAKVLAGAVAGARGSKVETGAILSLVGRPSQFAESLDISFPELLTLASVAVAGTTDPREAATQARAFFSQIGTKPSLRRVAKEFREGGLFGGLDYIQNLSQRRQDALFGSEVRSGSASRFFQKGSSQAQIRETLPRVIEAMRFASKGGNKDVLQELQRAMEDNTQIQQTLIPFRANLRLQEVQESKATGLVGREAVKQLVNSTVRQAILEAKGGGLLGRFNVTTMEKIVGAVHPFANEEQIVAGGVGRLERLRPFLGDRRTDEFIASIEDSFLRLMEGVERNDNAIERLIATLLEIFSGPGEALDATMNRFINATKGRPPLEP